MQMFHVSELLIHNFATDFCHKRRSNTVIYIIRVKRENLSWFFESYLQIFSHFDDFGFDDNALVIHWDTWAMYICPARADELHYIRPAQAENILKSIQKLVRLGDFRVSSFRVYEYPQ